MILPVFANNFSGRDSVKMTNKQSLIAAIKNLLRRDDLADAERVKLLALFAKLVPAPRRRKKAKTAKRDAHKTAPFERPS
jgi:hypothetical protein